VHGHVTPTWRARGGHVKRGRLDLLEQLALIISRKWDASSHHLHPGRDELRDEGLGRGRKVEEKASRESGSGQQDSKRVVVALNPKQGSKRVVVNHVDSS
jgi:hypothetical protein